MKVTFAKPVDTKFSATCCAMKQLQLRGCWLLKKRAP